jgi:hypothetical protein
MGKKQRNRRRASKQQQQNSIIHNQKKLKSSYNIDTSNESRTSTILFLDGQSAVSWIILENIFSFLDTPSLKECRCVSRKWADISLPLLMERSYFNINSFFNNGCSGVMRGDVDVESDVLSRRAEIYSSWKLELYDDFGGKNILGEGMPNFPRRWGKRVKSLCLVDFDLNPSPVQWLVRLLSCWCPNLKAIHFHFLDPDAPKESDPAGRSRCYGYDNSLKMYMGIVELHKDHILNPFPNLPNIQTISLGHDCDSSNSHLGIKLISSCPNLRHLYLHGLDHDRHSHMVYFRSGFRILEFLSRRPDITRKLETFHWKVNMGHQEADDEDCDRNSQSEYLYPEEERQPVRLLTDTLGDKKRDIPRMQFSDKLKSLHWDVLWVERVDELEGDDSGGIGLLPGTLDKTVAGSLRKLSTRKAVMDPTSFPDMKEDARARRDWVSKELGGRPPSLGQLLKPLYIQYVLMPNLVELEIGLRTCYTISLSDLLDAAPNLRTLQIAGCECCDVIEDEYYDDENGVDGADGYDDFPIEDIWKASDFSSSSSVRPHTNLKFLKAGVSMRNEEILQKTVTKFPNLEELWMGAKGSESRLGLESVFTILQDLRSLQRLKWHYEGISVQLADLIANLIAAGGMTMLENYELELQLDEEHVGLESYLERKVELLDNLKKWPKDSKCKISVSWNNSSQQLDLGEGLCTEGSHGKWNCYEVIRHFIGFVQDERLPIQFTSTELAIDVDDED